MKPHPSYLDSGIDWIGTLPSHWNQRKIKYIFFQRTERNDPVQSENILSLTIKQGVIPLSEKQSGGNKPKDDMSKYNLTYPGDIVLNSMNVIVGSVGLSKYFGVVSPVYYVLKQMNPNDNIEYFNNLFRTQIFQKSLVGLGNGILIKKTESSGKLNTIRMRIPMDKLNQVVIPYPPTSEQKRIVSYLHERTQKIDQLIDLTEQRIELFKEQRTSLINHCVTKGLNPNVEMKDSGVEWVGEIPSNWKSISLRYYVTKVGSGSTPRGGGETYQDEGVKFLRSQNIHFEGLHLDEIVHITEDTHSNMKNSQVRYGDVLLNITGGSIGRCCVVEVEDDFNVNQHVSILRTKQSLVNKYLNFILKSTIGQEQVLYNQTGGNREGLTSENIKNFKFGLPSRDEQVEIVNHLDIIEREYRKLIESETKRIILLTEYRQSLISEVVTGKIDVRDWNG
jgi:type I restriction enzyme, S subunit